MNMHPKKITHKDWCYIYNFENPREPIIVELEKGFGRELKKDMEKLIESLLEDFKNAFESENFEIEKNKTFGWIWNRKRYAFEAN